MQSFTLLLHIFVRLDFRDLRNIAKLKRAKKYTMTRNLVTYKMSLIKIFSDLHEGAARKCCYARVLAPVHPSRSLLAASYVARATHHQHR